MSQFKEAMSGQSNDLLTNWIENNSIGGLRPEPNRPGDYSTDPQSSARLADPNQVPMNPSSAHDQKFAQLMFGDMQHPEHRSLLIKTLFDWYMQNHPDLQMRGK